MLAELLGLFLTLLPAPPSGTGSVSGKVSLLKAGTASSEAPNVVVWIEGARAEGAPKGGVKSEMRSERKSFQPRVVVVAREATVDFPNVDQIFHNVFSVSAGNRFDLGLYRSGTSKPNVFHEPGLVRVYCNIHPQMVGFVMVVDSSFSAVTGRDGSFRFEGVPPGNWTVRVWHEEGGDGQAPARVRAGADAPVALTLDTSQFKAQPHKNKYG